MKLEIIKDSCIKCGMCMGMADTVFGYDPEGKAEVIKQEVTPEIENIAGSCPTGAIVITEN